MGNRREFEKAIIVLEEYEEDKKLTKLLIDIIREYKLFLPEQDTVSGNIPVYGETEDLTFHQFE